MPLALCIVPCTAACVTCIDYTVTALRVMQLDSVDSTCDLGSTNQEGEMQLLAEEESFFEFQKLEQIDDRKHDSTH